MGKAIEGATSTNALDRLVEETLADGSRHAVEKYLSGSASPEVGTTPAARRTYTYYEDGSLMGLRAESGSQALEPTSQRDLLGSRSKRMSRPGILGTQLPGARTAW